MVSKILNNSYLFCLLSFALFFTIACIAAISPNLLAIADTVIYCLLTFTFLKLRPPEKRNLVTVAIISAPVIIVILPIHILHYNETLVSLPALFGYFLGIIFGVLIFYSSVIFKFAWAGLILSLLVFMCIKGFDLWSNKINYGSYVVDTDDPVPPGFVLNQDNGQPFSLKDNTSKITVLDFWNTRCGVCFHKFPDLQRAHDRYTRASNIQFYAVNVPVERDTAGQGTAVFKSLKYSVTNLTTKNVKEASRAGILVFPTVLVIDHNRIIFRGDIDDLDNCLKKLL